MSERGTVAVASTRAMAMAVAIATIGIATSVPARAGGGGGLSGGALEITQLANHAELIKQVAQQAQMVSNQIREYATLIQNLRQLPENWVGQVTMPYREALTALMQLRTSVDELRFASQAAGDVFARRMTAMKLLDMTPQEYLEAELQLIQPKVIVALGRIAFDSILRIFSIRNSSWKFAHGTVFPLPDSTFCIPHSSLVCSYHPSQQNTLTGRLTVEMFDDIWAKAKELL